MLCLDGGDRKDFGCVWLKIYENSSEFFTLLHRQVFDLLDWRECLMKFEIRHSPHFLQNRHPFHAPGTDSPGTMKP